MKINPEIFKAYDIRGIYPDQIDEGAAYNIGRAYLDFVREKEKVDEPQIVVGRDARPSSVKLFRALTQGIIKQGGDVFDIGLSTTPMLYWAVNFLTAQGGIMVTASHNPAQYNGFKLTRGKAISLSINSGLKDIQKRADDGSFKKNETKETIKRKPILSYYIDFLTSKAKVDITGKVVVDTGNGMAALVLPRLLKRLKINYIPLFFKIDGTFPHHEANPFKQETLKDLKETIKKEKAILGIAFDGDGDRIAFLDEDQNIIRGDFIASLLAQNLLKKEKGKVLFDVRSLWLPQEIIREVGGEPILSKVGHSLIKEKMRKEKAIFAGETSGHYFFRDFFGCDSAVLAMIKIFEIMTESKKTLKELVNPFKKYYHSGEINFEVDDKKEIIHKLERDYQTGKIYHIDGLTVEFANWWFNVRPSNTEPLLRLNLEAKSKDLMEEKVKEIRDKITSR